MKTRFLFPNQFKKIGWMLFVPCVLVWFYGALGDYSKFEFEFLTIHEFGFYDGEGSTNNLIDEIIIIGIIIGCLLIGFSKEKNEDEMIAKIRLESLLWATYINYGLLVLAIIFVYDLYFFSVMVFNMFTMLVFFIIRFNFYMYRIKRSAKNEN